MASFSKPSNTLFFLILFSCAFWGYSQGVGDTLPCVSKLAPCQPYIKGSSTPPASCCVPLKEIVATDSKCLCDVFNNLEILKGLNVTQQEGLNLVKSCGANADTSLCRTAVTPTVGPSTPSVPESYNGSNSSSPPPPKSSATNVEGSLSFVAITCYFIISAF